MDESELKAAMAACEAAQTELRDATEERARLMSVKQTAADAVEAERTQLAIEKMAKDLNGAPDNLAARQTLAILERAGVFFPYDDNHLGRLGLLKLNGRNFLVQRDADMWQTIKIWQINLIPVN